MSAEAVVGWLNGRPVSAQEARVSLFDRGFALGEGVFETMKVVRGTPFALTRHLERLHRSAAILGLPVPPADELREAVAAIAGRLAEHPLARLRITLTAGPDPARGEPTLAVVGAPVAPLAPSESVVVVPWRRNEHAATAGAKTTSYAENLVALTAASRAGAGEALFLNTAGELCEGATSNVFCVRDGVAITPPAGSGCLAGVVRGLVLAWCAEVVERPLGPADLALADEIFLTSSLRDVQPVHLLDGRRPGGEQAPVPGSVTARIAAAYCAAAARDPDPR